MIDCIYVSASTLDARLTRICVASVRRAYPDIPVRLLVGGRLQPGLERELACYWNVQRADFPGGNYGWGFVKLEPLFGPPGERFLMLDSDTALTGPVLDSWADTDAPFIVDNEEYPPERIPDRYYDWTKVRAVDPKAAPPPFVFNSGQWVGSSGVLSRGDFDPWVEWTFPRRLRHPECFFPGDQGVLNYLLVQKAVTERLPVARRLMMRWPGHGMAGLEAGRVARGEATPVIVHWAGMKKQRHSEMVGADLLAYYEARYYAALPAPRFRKAVALLTDTVARTVEAVRLRAALRLRKVLAHRSPTRA